MRALALVDERRKSSNGAIRRMRTFPEWWVHAHEPRRHRPSAIGVGQGYCVANKRTSEFHRHPHADYAAPVRYSDTPGELLLHLLGESFRPLGLSVSIKPTAVESAPHRTLSQTPPCANTFGETGNEVLQTASPETKVVIVDEYDHGSARRELRLAHCFRGTSSIPRPAYAAWTGVFLEPASDPSGTLRRSTQGARAELSSAEPSPCDGVGGSSATQDPSSSASAGAWLHGTSSVGNSVSAPAGACSSGLGGGGGGVPALSLESTRQITRARFATCSPNTIPVIQKTIFNRDITRSKPVCISLLQASNPSLTPPSTPPMAPVIGTCRCPTA